MTDVRVRNHGTIVMVEPVSDEAKAWIERFVPLESWQWFGDAFAIEPRYVEDLFSEMREDGLEVTE